MSGPLNEAGERWNDDYGLDPRATETTEPQLTESDISELERAQIERRKSAEFQRLPIPPFVEDIDARREKKNAQR